MIENDGLYLSSGFETQPVYTIAYYDNHSAFFGVTAAFAALQGTENWLLTGRLSPAPVTAVFVLWFVLRCVPAVVKNARYHAAIALLFGLLFLMFVILCGLRLGGA